MSEQAALVAGPPRVVSTERLALVLWSPEVAADVRARRRRPEFHPDFPRPDDADAATLWVDGDAWGPRSIVRGRTVLGSIGFFGPPEPAADATPETEVGYGLVKEAWGWGFATEALQGLLAHTDHVGVRVRAGVRPDNRASVRVLAKCGFTELRGSDEEGRLMMARPLPGTASPLAGTGARRAAEREQDRLERLEQERLEQEQAATDPATDPATGPTAGATPAEETP